MRAVDPRTILIRNAYNNSTSVLRKNNATLYGRSRYLPFKLETPSLD